MIERASFAALLLLAAPVHAGFKEPKLEWGRSDTNLHMGVAFGASLAATEILEDAFEMKPWKATLLSTLAVGAAGLFKEHKLDAFPSASDMMANGVGLGANVVAQFTIHFDWTGSSPESCCSEYRAPAN